MDDVIVNGKGFLVVKELWSFSFEVIEWFCETDALIVTTFCCIVRCDSLAALFSLKRCLATNTTI